MALTIIGKASGTVESVTVPTVEIKPEWADRWAFRPELEVVSASVHAARLGVGRCEIQRRYGETKQPFETGFNVRGRLNLDGWWVRVKGHALSGPVVSWIGQITNETREPHATSSLASGVQRWVAQSPIRILDRIHVSEALWWRDGQERRLGWSPSFNARDEDDANVLVGNRTEEVHGETYLFGGTDLWSRFDVVTYLLAQFADEGGVTGPLWVLGGQANLLQGSADLITMRGSETLGVIVRRIIHPRLGVDFTVAPIGDQGFEINVFALSATPRTFGGQTLPSNPNTVSLAPAVERGAVDVTVVQSSEERYGLLRVLGERIVCCCSLEGPDDTLDGKWTEQLAASVRLGANSDDPTVNDDARNAHRLRSVFTNFGAPKDWNHQGGAAAPTVDSDGFVTEPSSETYQNVIRNTLSWLPLQTGFDYTSLDPQNQNPAEYNGELMPPMAFVFDEDKAKYVSPELKGINVGAPGFDWGIILQALPPHLLAKGHFAGNKPTNTEPEIDYEKSAATIAFRTDVRLTLEYKVADSPTPSQGVLNVEAPGAELWYLAPGTVVALDTEGALVRSPRAGLVLRNDNWRLSLIMAGAIARHAEGRGRARVRLVGFQPWTHLLGHILIVTEQDASKDPFAAPITSVEYVVGEQPETIISAGHAR